MIFVPLVLFILFVAPLWLILHYRARARDAKHQVPDAAAPELQTLSQAAEKMERRIASLEALLDAESPGWRTRNG